ncbi:MAG TPA: DUF2147 domain-containing protein [Chitinophagales bacterium]|nr:DUF2147 domain-containing protein [Chitinophagales bacterium]
MKNFIAVIFCLAFGLFVFAAGNGIEHTWFNQEKDGKILIYKEHGNYYGKIVWLKQPTENGKPRLDTNNPESELAKKPLLGTVVMKNFTQKNENEFVGGTIYDPKNGKTYSCKMTLKGNVVDVRGYIGIPAFGRTTVWTLAEN